VFALVFDTPSIRSPAWLPSTFTSRRYPASRLRFGSSITHIHPQDVFTAATCYHPRTTRRHPTTTCLAIWHMHVPFRRTTAVALDHERTRCKDVAFLTKRVVIPFSAYRLSQCVVRFGDRPRLMLDLSATAFRAISACASRDVPSSAFPARPSSNPTLACEFTPLNQSSRLSTTTSSHTAFRFGIPLPPSTTRSERMPVMVGGKFPV
jgi:hypothetical protein